MLKIKVEKLLAYSTQELLDNLEGDFILVFRDGELFTNDRETIYSSYIWDYHRKYPDAPLLVSHHVKHLNGNGETSANAHLKMINTVMWSIYDYYQHLYEDQRVLIDNLCKLGYEITNTMYNELSYALEEYVTSLDILDFIGITKHHSIITALENAEPTQDGIEAVSKLLQDKIKSEPDFVGNPLAIAIRTGLARMGQALQCLGPRGYLTDVDSELFKYPIMSSYISGVRSLYDSLIESRSAAKSLMNSAKPLQDSEYFSRRQQLVCQNVKHLHLGDCGSTNYLLWHVRDVRYEGPNKVSNGDLSTIAGKYYYCDIEKKLKVVKKTDTHLIGQTIKMRSVVAGCNHPDPYGVCSVCYGEVALSVPANTNLGQIACVIMTAILGQNILSTKHFDGSSAVEGIVLRPMEKKYLTSETNGNRYFLNEKLKGKNVKLGVNIADASGLPVIKLVKDVYQCSVSRISEFPMCMITVDGESTSLNVAVNVRKSSFSHDFLNYVKEKGYAILENGQYEFDMNEWDYSKPIFILPMSHYNMSLHQSEIAKMLESTADEMEKRSSMVSPTAMLVEFYDLVNHRLQVNLAVLEVILYSSMVVSAVDNNYDLPKPWTTSGLGVMRMLLRNRSLSAQMGYQGHRETFTDPTSYTNTNRMSHVFDCAIMPHEVMKLKENRR